MIKHINTTLKHLARKFAALLAVLILQTQLGGMAMADEYVLKFSTHDFRVECYSASDVRVKYAGRLHELSIGELSSAKTPRDETRYPSGIFGTYRAFVDPVQLEWRSHDGTPLQASVNLDEIFKDRKVLHHEDPARIYKPMPMTEKEPLIIVEVNDRTVNVYMLTSIQLIPADPEALVRDEHVNRILAYSKTY